MSRLALGLAAGDPLARGLEAGVVARAEKLLAGEVDEAAEVRAHGRQHGELLRLGALDPRGAEDDVALIDSGYPKDLPLVVESIQRAGGRVDDAVELFEEREGRIEASCLEGTLRAQ